MAKVIWTQTAREDLRGIHAYVAADSPRAADILVDRLLSSSDRLEAFPESGRSVPEFADSRYRELCEPTPAVLHDVAPKTCVRDDGQQQGRHSAW